MLLEQAAIGYVFPDEIQKSQPDAQSQNNAQSSDNSNTKSKSPEQDWQFVIPVSTPTDKGVDERDENGDVFEIDASKECIEQFNGDVEMLNENASGATEVVQTSGIIPAARARLASLRDLGAKKIGALKLKLIENKIKSTDRGENKQTTKCERIELKTFFFLHLFFFRSQSPKCHAIDYHAYAKFCTRDSNDQSWPIFHRTIFTRHTFVECIALIFGYNIRAQHGH